MLFRSDMDGLPFYTMPFVEGESLRARLAGGRLPIAEITGILRDVAKALAYAHERGIVHRDIKPDNVLLSGGTAVVTDFGIAKAISAARTQPRRAVLTDFGMAIGTPAYMAPEQASGDQNIDHRADLYALGAMAYELLAGHAVFPDLTPHAMLVAHMAEIPRPVSELRPDTPAALADIVMRCLGKFPAERPDSARDVVRALDGVTTDGGVSGMATVQMARPVKLRSVLGTYLGAAAAVAVFAKAAVVGIGLPTWVVPGALLVVALGFPVVAWTEYVQRVAHRAMLTPGGVPGAPPAGAIARLAMKEIGRAHV